MKKYFVLFPLVAILLLFSPFLRSDVLLSGDVLPYWTIIYESYKTSFESGILPLWSEYYWAGRPLLANPEFPLFDLSHLLLLVFPAAYALNLTVLLHSLLAGLGMFLLVRYLTKNEWAASISAVFYVLSGYYLTIVRSGWLSFVSPIAWIPFVFYFAVRAQKSQRLMNTALCASFLALQFLSGGTMIFLFTVLSVCCFYAYNAVYSYKSKKTVYALIGSFVILFLILFGFILVKYIPTIEFVELTSRAGALPFSEHVGHHTTFETLFPYMLLQPSHMYVGFIALVLAVLSFLSLKRNQLFFGLLGLFFLILSFGGPLSQLMYNIVPGFDQFRHVNRVLIIFSFSVAVLAGYGFCQLPELLKKQKIKPAILCLGVLILLVGEMYFLHQAFNDPVPYQQQLSDNFVIQEIVNRGEDPWTYRIWNIGLREFTGSTSAQYSSVFGIQNADPGGNIWMPEVTNFHGTGRQISEEKTFANLNVKYVISDRSVNTSYYRLLSDIDSCPDCQPTYTKGPYLYEHTTTMPRAYVVDSALLFIGPQEAQTRNMFAVFAHPLYELSKFVLIKGAESSASYQLSDLQQFSAVVLGEQTLGNPAALQAYKDQGGILIPDPFEEQNPDEQIAVLLNVSGNYEEVSFSSAVPHEIELDVSGRSGFLVLSEKYSLIPGWRARLDGSERSILGANFIISAIRLDGSGSSLRLFYWPDFLSLGLLIFVITLLIVFFLIILRKRLP